MTPGNKSGATFLISSSPAPPESETYTTVDKRLYQRNQTGILRRALLWPRHLRAEKLNQVQGSGVMRRVDKQRQES